MRIEEWPIYITDDGKVECYATTILSRGDERGVAVGGCDAWDWSGIGRRTQIGEFLAALRKHAKEAHNFEFENDLVVFRSPDGRHELAYNYDQIDQFGTENELYTVPGDLGETLRFPTGVTNVHVKFKKDMPPTVEGRRQWLTRRRLARLRSTITTPYRRTRSTAETASCSI